MSSKRKLTDVLKVAMPDRYALDHKGNLVSAEHVLKTPKTQRDLSWICLESSQELRFREGTTRRAHFVRKSETGHRRGFGGDGGGAGGGMETNEHKAAKLAIVQNLHKITFRRDCDCQHVLGRWNPSAGATAQEEKWTDNSKTYKADVLVSNTNGHVEAILEVRQTHAVDAEKRRALSNIPNVQLFEVGAQDVLDCFEKQSDAWILTDEWFQCERCDHEKKLQEEKDLETRKHQRLAESKREDELRHEANENRRLQLLKQEELSRQQEKAYRLQQEAEHTRRTEQRNAATRAIVDNVHKITMVRECRECRLNPNRYDVLFTRYKKVIPKTIWTADANWTAKGLESHVVVSDRCGNQKAIILLDHNTIWTSNASSESNEHESHSAVSEQRDPLVSGPCFSVKLSEVLKYAETDFKEWRFNFYDFECPGCVQYRKDTRPNRALHRPALQTDKWGRIYFGGLLPRRQEIVSVLPRANEIASQLILQPVRPPECTCGCNIHLSECKYRISCNPTSPAPAILTKSNFYK